MSRKILFFTTIMLLLIFAAVQGQEAKSIKQMKFRQDTPEFEKDISVVLRLLDVDAFDSEGKAVTDLRREDFSIKVNGQPVEIKTFDSFFQGQRGGIEDLAEGNIPNAIAPARKLVFVFDQAYSGYRGLRKAKAAAIEFVKRNLSPGDMVSVISYERNLKFLLEFTRDREKLVEAIEGIKYRMISGARGSQVFETENEFNIRNYLQNMERLAHYLSSFQGRKSMILLSEGFTQDTVLRSLMSYQRRMLEQFNNANTSIYTIDIAGLDVDGGSASQGFYSSSRLRSRHDTLGTFASETRGKFFRGNNNLEKLLLDIDTDISNYYVLGFYVSGIKDGRFREVEVSCNRPGVDLKYRDGFFADKPFDEMSSLEKGVHLEEGFNRSAPVRELDVDFIGYVFPRSDGSAVATIAMDAPVESAGKAEFEIYGAAFNKDDKMIDLAHKTIKFSSVNQRRFHFLQTFNMESGGNIIKIVLRDNLTGKRCYYFVNARMPMVGDGIQASSIIFESARKDYLNNSAARGKSFKKDYDDIKTGEPANPLTPMLRQEFVAASTNVMKAGKHNFVMKLSGVNLQKPAILLTAKVKKQGGEEVELQVSKPEMMPVNRSGEAFAKASVDLSGLDKGTYIINVTVHHTDSKDVVVQASEIVIN